MLFFCILNCQSQHTDNKLNYYITNNSHDIFYLVNMSLYRNTCQNIINSHYFLINITKHIGKIRLKGSKCKQIRFINMMKSNLRLTFFLIRWHYFITD